MMNFETFLSSLMLVSTFTGLATEAIKKTIPSFDLKYGSSVVAGIVSIVLSVGVSAAYMVINAVAISPTAIVYTLAMAFLSWLCSTLGYDKVVKVITQFKK